MLLVLGMASLSSIYAATIVVTSMEDSGPGSLRQAVSDAAPGDVVTFSLNGVFILSSGEILIDKDLTIRGNGVGKTTLSGNQTNRIFNIANAATVTIVDLRMLNGFTLASGGALQNVDGTVYLSRIIVQSSVAAGPDPTQGGGGIHNRGKMMIREATIRSNRATGAAGSGGGILNAGDGELEILFTSIMKNQANRAGGGIEDASSVSATTYLNTSKVDTNTVFMAPGNGGGIHIGGGNFRIVGGTVSGNTAGSEGGGVWNGTGVLRLSGVAVNGNTASGDEADNGGGGLYNDGGMMYVSSNSTVNGNIASGISGSGGGILNAPGGALFVNQASITGNQANRAGGGIEDASGTLAVSNVFRSEISGNEVMNNPGNGGGIHLGGDSRMTVRSTLVSSNTAGAEGGGVWNAMGSLKLSDVTLDGNVASGNEADQGGGGAYNDGGVLRIEGGTAITNNTALGTSGSGGGVFNAAGGTLYISGSTISGNAASRAGGGIEDASGVGSPFRVQGTEITDNRAENAPGNGGGIHIGGDGELVISYGTVNNNFAGSEGGGIWLGSGKLRAYGMTIDGNTAAGDDADQGGGGVYSDGGGFVSIYNNTLIANNQATGVSGSGGGILNNTGSRLELRDVTVSGNSANRAGGGIEDASGSTSVVLIRRTVINDNVVNTNPGNGGGLHVGGDGNVNIYGGEISGNTAGSEGGGVWNNVGSMRVDRVILNGNTASGDDADTGGGALFNNGGTMLVVEATVTNNLATGSSGSGGGLLSTDNAVTVRGGTFSGNTANRAGGAVEIIDGTYQSTDVTYTGNSTGQAPGNGGALHVTGMASTISITGGSVVDNTAFNQGGGLWNQMGSTMNVTNVSIMNNNVAADNAEQTDVAGGGIYNQGGILNVTTSTIASNNVVAVEPSETAGGGIANDNGGTLMVMTSTISGNTASIGGGIANVGTATITNSTITENVAGEAGGYAQDLSLEGETASSVTVKGTIIADNTAAGNRDFGVGSGSVTSGGYNLVGFDGANEFPAVATDLEGVSANLMPLADNGGMTMTHEPMCDETTASPVVDMGDPTDFSEDQLGQAVYGGIRDIGAFEKQTDCPVVSGFGSSAGLDLTEQNSRVQEMDAVAIYPNPVVGDVMNVTMPDTYTGEVTLRIMDASGRVRDVIKTSASSSYPLQLSSVNTGSYILQVVNGESVETLRFVVSH